VKLTRHRTRASFSEAAESFLLEAEAENGLMLGLLGALRAEVEVGGPVPVLATVAVEGQTVACALRTPPHRVVITRGPDRALEVLAREFAATDSDPAGVLGPREATLTFSARWSAATGRGHEVIMEQGIYRLDPQDLAVPEASGHLRSCTRDDVELLATWIEDFHEQAPPPHSDPRAVAEQRVGERSIFVWDDRQPVSVIGLSGPTPNGIRVSLVYTPPESRGRGYASALVGGLSRHLLEGGKDFCFLYTDMASPTPNKIYRELGYRLVCDGVLVDFE
jgi:uncharacterized protein